MLRADRDYKSEGISRGDYLRVEKVDQDKNTLHVSSQTTGKTHEINPEQRTNFTAYTPQQSSFAEGDKGTL